jgi:putative drug exporter of the RND superfamily
VLERLASASYRHRWRVLSLWFVGLVAIIAVSGSLAGKYASGSRLDGTDSQAAYDLISDNEPGHSHDYGYAVFQSAQGIESQATRAAITRYLADVAATKGIQGVTSPYDVPTQISADHTIALAPVEFDPDVDQSVTTDAANAMRSKTGALNQSGVRVEFSGNMFQDGTVPASEMFGIAAAIVILLIAFGSIVAMGLPITTAIAGVLASVAGVGLWAAVVKTPDFTVQVASMIGIGVGIDYALFIVTRYRTALHRGLAPEHAVRESMGTAGRAVVFAGVTVMISLLGLLLMGLDFVQGLAFGTASAVLIAVLAAVTLLPALLGFAGRRIDRLAIHRRDHQSGRLAHRWSRVVQRRPVAVAAAGAGALLILAAPVFAMRLATADEGNDPATSTTRQAYDLVADGFGPGANGPLLVVVETPTGAARDAVQSIADRVAATPGVTMVTPVAAAPSGEEASFTAFPSSAPQSKETASLVRHLRSDVLPQAERDGAVAHIGGETASNVDFADLMSRRLPYFIAAVLVLSFLLLMAVFRSVLVPLKAVIMNLLSIGAAYGVMVAVFQWGWLGSAIGVSGGAPIEPWAPMMLFAIVFGLSMDYEVFLLSSIRERYLATGDNGEAVVDGLASTARVITAAAAIMVCVFGSFVVGDERSIKLIGLGLASAVLIDATLVRMVLVPATMELLGRRNWWMPRWLDRIVPRLDVEQDVDLSELEPEREAVPV